MYTDTLAAAPDGAANIYESSHSTPGSSAAPIDEQQVILRYLYLVQVAVARIKRIVPAHISADDLYSVGVAGLMAAARKFNPDTERTFASFAQMRIRGAMLDELRRMDSCSRRCRIRAREFEAATNEIEQRLGRAATPDEIYTSLGLTQTEYLKRVEEAKPIRLVTLDSEPGHGEGSGPSLHNLLADENDETGREQLEKAELVDLLTHHIAGLPEMPRKILAMYYFEGMRFSSIAEAFDLTESRISQIHRATIEGLRKWIKVAREK